MKRTIMILTAILALSIFAGTVMADTAEGTLVDGKCYLGMGAKGTFISFALREVGYGKTPAAL